MATVKNGAYLKGDTELLPDDLFEAYNKYYDEAEELLSMKECGLSAPEDINDQKDKVNALYNDWKKMMEDKLCIGREQGPLKDLGTYDIPEWALCAMENGDYEGMTEEEEHIFHEFFEKHFPEGFVSSIDWNNPSVQGIPMLLQVMESRHIRQSKPIQSTSFTPQNVRER